jgi:hypothetical protein
MEQSISGAVEHRVHMPAHGVRQGKGAKPEQLLNGFVRVLAVIERVGNALGTLAFTWATVVLLGGYPTVLRRGLFRDFWCATIIVFLEAIRYAVVGMKTKMKLPFNRGLVFKFYRPQHLEMIFRRSGNENMKLKTIEASSDRFRTAFIPCIRIYHYSLSLSHPR